MALTARVIAEDHRLEKQTESAAGALMKHRWHWVRDETNPRRVTEREYAQAVGRGQSTIHRDAVAYEILVRGPADTPSEARERANMGAETEAATEAVAKARGVGLYTARKARGTEVRRVREIARERAEQRGTTVGEEAARAAEWIVKAEQAQKAHAQERTEKSGLRFIEMEKELETAKRPLMRALSLARSVPWGDEERELLEATLANVKALIDLIDMAFAGTADIDWDDELKRITGSPT